MSQAQFPPQPNPYAVNNIFTNNIFNPLAQQPQNRLIPNVNQIEQNILGLKQIEGFKPVRSFVDNSNTEWVLIKESTNSIVDIPDPKNIQVVEFWARESQFFNDKGKVYIYVVEGLRPPRTKSELPTRILYQWFSMHYSEKFTPSLITAEEWLNANVYAAQILDTKPSKFVALCQMKAQSQEVRQGKSEETPLIQVQNIEDNSDGSIAQGDTNGSERGQA